MCFVDLLINPLNPPCRFSFRHFFFENPIAKPWIARINWILFLSKAGRAPHKTWAKMEGNSPNIFVCDFFPATYGGLKHKSSQMYIISCFNNIKMISRSNSHRKFWKVYRSVRSRMIVQLFWPLRCLNLRSV